ncbi:hypothetical protein AYM02_10825 (plasmid) [Coxiella burnetii]|uniref:DUF807 family protein n=1 Tax=Coxiella burnetii TaxID=777 RepID=UPI0000DAEACE|nr:DUF807 family protein [Coxiella burnetii]ABX77212.1 conserved hypothetical protein [Coxiella burnetii RSA 331]AML49855.1 hypothetical protein AUR58_00075 [Coxiella burnetii]AML55756.1 hypothetical protein AYM38_10760 [Coxiella burnetii]ATN67748.1 hypothetical protein AYM00_11105 [Coxiella burnetii]ATN71654.1 hypothetical protein AYM02_10825 [Coxiella burnetii]
MLQANLTFLGKTSVGPIMPRSYFGNAGAIQAPRIQKTATGEYTITFLTSRDIKETQPPAVHINFQDEVNGAFCSRLVKPVQFTYHPENSQLPWKILFQIAVQKGDGSYTDSNIVMITFAMANCNNQAVFNSCKNRVNAELNSCKPDDWECIADANTALQNCYLQCEPDLII